jgi:hypothetical protein
MDPIFQLWKELLKTHPLFAYEMGRVLYEKGVELSRVIKDHIDEASLTSRFRSQEETKKLSDALYTSS